MPEITKSIVAPTREAWRRWLSKNHEKENEIWLIKHKRHTGKPALNAKEAMEEAICFGWIDTIVKRIDENTFAQCFKKRTDKSRWSKNALSYGKEMIKQGKMTPAGLKRYQEGVKKPTIDHDLPKNPKTPEDLKKLLNKNKKALETFDKLSPSARRYSLWWIEKAKQLDTRKKRVDIIFERLKAGKKSLM